MMEYFSSKCYWLSCLMALNNPPLQLYWPHPHVRVAEKVHLAIKTVDLESMNYLVNENIMEVMYEDLWKQWDEITRNMGSRWDHSPDVAKLVIQKQFRCAAQQMKEKKRNILQVFQLNVSSTQQSQKVTEYAKLSIQNLQLAVYHSWNDTAAQTLSIQRGGVKPEDMMKYFSSKCYWLSCLMALNNPPLQLYWEHLHVRVAGKAMKTVDLDNMNSLVNENIMKEMYEDLRKQWDEIKLNMDSLFKSPDDLKGFIQKQFRYAAQQMKEKKRNILHLFQLNVSSTQQSQKVTEYAKLSILNLQLAVYHSWNEAAAQTRSHQRKGVKPEDVMENLSSKCYWLGCLMALNNPPLQVYWEQHCPRLDPCNIFPQDFRSASAM